MVLKILKYNLSVNNDVISVTMLQNMKNKVLHDRGITVYKMNDVILT